LEKNLILEKSLFFAVKNDLDFFLCTCKVSIKKNKYAYNNLSS